MSLTREEKEAAARTRMAELAAKFAERSAGDLEVMRASLARLATGDVHSLEEIRHLAHRMGGTGATLGFETLADRALRIERLAGSGDAVESLALATALDALDVELGRLKGT